MKHYTIVGYYQDTEQRFCKTIRARGVCHAQMAALDRWQGLVICGVFLGKLLPADHDFDKVTFDRDFLP